MKLSLVVWASMVDIRAFRRAVPVGTFISGHLISKPGIGAFLTIISKATIVSSNIGYSEVVGIRYAALLLNVVCMFYKF